MGLELAKEPLKLKDFAPRQPEKVEIAATLDALKDIAAKFMPRAASLVLWARDGIVWGAWDGQDFTAPGDMPLPANWVELRLFNATEEIYLWQKGETLIGRYIADKPGEGGKAVDSFSRLWGQKAADQDNLPPNFVRLRDVSRKLELVIPFVTTGKLPTWYGLTTRNYVGCDEKTGLAGYVDYRYVTIESAEGA
ncbi:MAG: hypothetical protein IJ849_01690 [Selenomonadaceae bacterium]|nr:hypothetical protein [Selenomonadaceae bacterium]